MTGRLFLELAFLGLMFGTLIVVSERRIAEATSALDALRADIKMALRESTTKPNSTQPTPTLVQVGLRV